MIDALFNDGESLGLMDVFPIIIIAYRHYLCRLSVYARVTDLFPCFDHGTSFSFRLHDAASIHVSIKN